MEINRLNAGVTEFGEYHVSTQFTPFNRNFMCGKFVSDFVVDLSAKTDLKKKTKMSIMQSIPSTCDDKELTSLLEFNDFLKAEEKHNGWYHAIINPPDFGRDQDAFVSSYLHYFSQAIQDQPSILEGYCVMEFHSKDTLEKTHPHLHCYLHWPGVCRKRVIDNLYRISQGKKLSNFFVIPYNSITVISKRKSEHKIMKNYLLKLDYPDVQALDNQSRNQYGIPDVILIKDTQHPGNQTQITHGLSSDRYKAYIRKQIVSEDHLAQEIAEINQFNSNLSKK